MGHSKSGFAVTQVVTPTLKKSNLWEKQKKLTEKDIVKGGNSSKVQTKNRPHK